MMSCIESYTRITAALKDNTDTEMKEALWVLEQFKELFENIDRAVNDPEMKDICRNLTKIHAGVMAPLTQKPVQTIQDEYRKRTGKTLPNFFCIGAYYTTKSSDLQEKVKAAIEERKAEAEADKKTQKHTCACKETGVCTCKDCACKETGKHTCKSCTCGGEQK